MWVAGVLLAFILPVIYIVIKEWRRKKASEKDNGLPVKKRPLDRRALAGVSVILFAIILPSVWLSDISYSFYRKEAAALKVAFKHSGGRVAECDEADLIKKEGERYRRELKDTRQVKMSMSKLGGCSRERHPVVVELYMDGRKLLDRAYAPTGLKRDMASYVFEEFLIEPGLHRVEAKLYRSGPGRPADFSLDHAMELRAGEIRVVRFDEKEDALLIE
ncbi:MAG: hypothetical protein HY955_01415 [Deltaproteobacteria bacterium]|nr:hypothetical protein [Deltaproteobacteria bacterium]